MIMHNSNGWCNNDCNNYASKGLANGLGIPAVVLGGLAFANQMGNGGFGGLFGGNQNALAAAGVMNSAKDAEIANLKSQLHTDEKTDALKDNLLRDWIKPLSDTVARNQTEIAVLRKDLECCCTQNASAIAQVAATLNGITRTVVPNNAICPGWGPVVTSAVPVDPKATAINVVGNIRNASAQQ